MITLVFWMIQNEMLFQVETLIEQYKKDQGNLPCKLAIACARPLSEAEVNYGKDNGNGNGNNYGNDIAMAMAKTKEI